MKDDLQFDDSDQDPFEQTSLPFHEQATPANVAEPAAAASAPVTVRCESCGGSMEAGKLCPGCKQAFRQVLDTSEVLKNLRTIPTSEFDALFAALEEAQARSKEPVVPAIPAAAEGLHPAIAPEPAVVPAAAPVPTPATPMPQFDSFVPPPASGVPESKTIALRPEPAAPAAVPPAIAEPALPPHPAFASHPELDAQPEPIAEPPAPADAASASDAPTPSAVGEPKAASSPVAKAAALGAIKRVATAAAAVVVLAAIGVPLTKLWVGRQQQTIVASKPAAAPKPAPIAKTTHRPGAPSAVPSAAPAAVAAPERTHAPAAVAPAATAPRAAAMPKPSATPQRATVTAPVKPAPKPAAKPVRPARPSSQTPAFATAAPVVESSAEILPAAAEVVPVAAPAPVAQESPIGPFYESTQVDKTPQVLSRVEPELSPELQSRANGEIVVVRFLVTQTGRPVLVSLLRQSKTGMALDEAVIAAIKKWTFAPATKRGRAVSCFVHLGVPIGR